jgi:trimethylamine--corrinoid protein Co-methyltransferase
VASAAVVHHPEIRRGIPLMEVTNQEGVELIHDFAMRVAEQIGCDFQDGESLASSYLHHARNPERTVRVGDGHAVVSPSYGAPFVRDMEGVRRYATLEDLNNLQKLNHMASTVHIAGGTIVEPVDIPVPHRHLHMAYSGLKYSDKPIIGNVTARERAADTVDMMKLVFGEEFATNNTVTTSLINANSPLVWDETMLDALKVYAMNNQAVMCSPFSMAAASTPASNVGTVGVVLAEALMAMAMTQIIRPGSPMLFGVPAMTVALNSGAPVHGSPDSAMVQFLSNAMARHYKVPHRAILNVATSKSGDMQAAYDSMWGLFPSMLSGADWLTMAGGMLEGALTVGYGNLSLPAGSRFSRYRGSLRNRQTRGARRSLPRRDPHAQQQPVYLRLAAQQFLRAVGRRGATRQRGGRRVEGEEVAAKIRSAADRRGPRRGVTGVHRAAQPRDSGEVISLPRI